MHAEPRFEHHYGAVVVGGGQAGLSASYCLSSAGIDHVVFEKKSAMHKWRDERWDNFCLVTPNWQCQLPGHSYGGPDPHGFMVKEEIVDYLDGFARKAQAPLRENVTVLSVEKTGDRFGVVTSEGRCTADAVFLATSLYGTPSLPRAVERIPESILQIHSADYRNAASLPEGAVVVVGSGPIGGADRRGSAFRRPQGPSRHGQRAAVCSLLSRSRRRRLAVGHRTLRHCGRGRGHGPQASRDTNHYLTGRDGGRDIDLRTFAREGMTLYGRLRAVEKGRMQFNLDLRKHLDEADRVYNGINALIDRYIGERGIDAPPGAIYSAVWQPLHEPSQLDLAGAGVSAIVWATGFVPDWSYVQIPIFDGTGYPVHRRGVTPESGAYVLGLPWLWTWGSGRFLSVGRDAEFLVRYELARRDGAKEAA